MLSLVLFANILIAVLHQYPFMLHTSGRKMNIDNIASIYGAVNKNFNLEYLRE